MNSTLTIRSPDSSPSRILKTTQSKFWKGSSRIFDKLATPPTQNLVISGMKAYSERKIMIKQATLVLSILFHINLLAATESTGSGIGEETECTTEESVLPQNISNDTSSEIPMLIVRRFCAKKNPPEYRVVTRKKPLYIGRPFLKDYPEILAILKSENAELYGPEEEDLYQYLTRESFAAKFFYLKEGEQGVPEEGFYYQVLPTVKGTQPTNARRASPDKDHPRGGEWEAIAHGNPIKVNHNDVFDFGGHLQFKVSLATTTK